MNRAEMKKDSMTTFTCLWVSWISLSSLSKTGQTWEQHLAWTHLEPLLLSSHALSLRPPLPDGKRVFVFVLYLFSANWDFCRQAIGHCDGKFLGHRYADPSDPSLVGNLISFTFMHWMYSCSVKPTLTSVRCRWSSSTMQATSRECSLSSWRGTWTCPSTTSPSRQNNNILGKMMEIVQAVYVQDVWMGEVAWFTTAYFVDPLVICNGGRSSL